MYEIFIHDNSIKLIYRNFELKLIFESDKIISQSLIKQQAWAYHYFSLFNKDEDLT